MLSIGLASVGLGHLAFGLAWGVGTAFGLGLAACFAASPQPALGIALGVGLGVGVSFGLAWPWPRHVVSRLSGAYLSAAIVAVTLTILLGSGIGKLWVPVNDWIAPMMGLCALFLSVSIVMGAIFGLEAAVITFTLLMVGLLALIMLVFVFGLFSYWAWITLGTWLSALASGSGMLFGWLMAYFRVPINVVHAITSRRVANLKHNPYLWDDTVVLPTTDIARHLSDEATRDPETGARFAAFLLEHRPLQRTLAAEVLHAVTAGRWALAPLDPQALAPPPLVEEEPGFRPSHAWLAALADLSAQLTAARQETQISFRRAAYQGFRQQLDTFRDQTLRESQEWARHYLAPLDLWRSEAAKGLRRIEDQARTLEPIAVNVYRPGAPLRPGPDAGLFLGREDVRRALSREVQTAAELPLLLIQGQRRVGKTSLLNFLPELLGPGFRVVFQDCQGGRCPGSRPGSGTCAAGSGWPSARSSTAGTRGGTGRAPGQTWNPG